MEIVTKAKRSCTAFEKPCTGRTGRGRPAKKGKTIHLRELLGSHKEQFMEVETELYGKKEKLRYYNIDLLRGQKLYQELRFVLVEYHGTQSILAGTSLELDALSMIRLYSYRFWIECMFRELKQQTGAFSYHFWSRHMPKLDRYRKKAEASPLEQVEDCHACKKIFAAVRAIEMHMVLSCIAMGILQTLAIRPEGKLSPEQIQYQRTHQRERYRKAPRCVMCRSIFFYLWRKTLNCA